MKKKSMKTLGLGLGAFAAAAFCCGVGFALASPNTRVNAAQVEFGAGYVTPAAESNAGYNKVGAQFVASSNQIDVNGTKVFAEYAVVTYPDGSLRKGDSMTFDQAGRYEITLYGKNGEESVQATSYLNVYESLYQFSNGQTTAAWKTADTITNGDKMKTATAGIDVSLQSGDAFTFKKAVNLNEIADKEGMVDILTVYPQMELENGIVAADYFTVKVVDCYDPDNFLEFYTWKKAGMSYYYCGGGAANQELFGLEYYDNIKVNMVVGNHSGRSHYGKRYTTSNIYGNVYKSSTNAVYQSGGIQVSLNVHTWEGFIAGAGGGGFLTDFDSPVIYGENIFQGFTTGEVYVSIEGQNWNAPSLNMQITSVFGMEGEALKEGMVSDAQAPNILLNSKQTDGNGYVLSKGEEFTLPTVTVRDVNGSTRCDVAVYYNYVDENNRGTVAFVKDGKFTPDKKGVYTAVYTATDGFGNVAQKTVPLRVGEKKPFTYTERKLSALSACEENILPVLNDLQNLNDVASLQTSVYVIDPTGTRKAVALGEDGYSFIPEAIGQYKVEYVFEDNAYVRSFVYTVNSEDKGQVFFRDELAVPAYFIKGAAYDLEEYVAYTASANGLTGVNADLYVSVDGGEEKKVADMRKFVATEGETLTFTAQYGDKKSAPVTAKVVDVNYANEKDVNEGRKVFESYFQGDYAQAITGEMKEDKFSAYEYIQYEFAGGKAVEQMTYITPVILDAFALEYTIPEGQAKYEEISVVIRKIGDSKEGYRFTLKEFSENAYTYEVTNLAGKLYSTKQVVGSIASKHTLTYNHRMDMMDGEGYAVALDPIDGQITFAIETKSSAPVGESYRINVEKICGSVFKKKLSKSNDNLLSVVYDISVSSRNFGGEYELPEFRICSPFYPVSAGNLTFTMRADGNVVKDVDGTSYENVTANRDGGYSFLLSAITIYRADFTYTAKDGTSMRFNSAGKTYIVSALDSVAPTVTFEEGYDEETLVKVKLGTAYTAQAYTLEDNVTPVEELYSAMMIANAHDKYVAWNQTSYVFTEAGYYKVMVYCRDGAGNYVLRYYNVLAE